MDKKNVAVFFGGRSCEHEISIITGLQLIEYLDTNKFNIIPVYIARDGRWYSGQELLNRAIYKDFENKKKVLNEVTLYPYLGQKGLTVTKKACFFGEKIIPVDIYFPAFHGEFGEDGCIQGLFELAGVPYVGSGVLPSAIAMSKNTAKTVVSQYGIPVLPSVTINKELVEKEGIEATKKEIFANNTLKYPVFIKPNNLGSSIGVSKATNDEELLIALTKVFKRDKEALIEPYMDNMFEINISVLDTTEGLRTSVVEIPVTDGSFLSYEDKYMREGKGKKKGGTPKRSEGMASLTRSINPVDLDEKIKNTVSEYAKIAYKAIKASGVGRIDFMYDKNSGTIYLNEFNLIPGSLSFYLWEKSDPVLLYTEELTKIIDRAFEVYSIKQELDRDTGFKAL
ncbi:MAG: D-alanine--D-alanine ligase family protein [Bdellovibrionota bacterium]|nr:D-alanine--D-alanine ligase [Pseudomonadota bacterium]MDY6091060.1 D-alanine--D-alanine ligase family protein [Bdellovibrionota bacterium]